MRFYIYIGAVLTKNNPSVSYADSSLYTREPEFAVNRKCKCHTVKKNRSNNGFSYTMKLSKVLHIGESRFVDEAICTFLMSRYFDFYPAEAIPSESYTPTSKR